MQVLTKVEALSDWAKDKDDEVLAAITLRIALRGIVPIFDGVVQIGAEAETLRVLNTAYVYLADKSSRPQLRSVLQNARNMDSLSEAKIFVKQVDYFEGASARRQTSTAPSRPVG